MYSGKRTREIDDLEEGEAPQPKKANVMGDFAPMDTSSTSSRSSSGILPGEDVPRGANVLGRGSANVYNFPAPIGPTMPGTDPMFKYGRRRKKKRPLYVPTRRTHKHPLGIKIFRAPRPRSPAQKAWGERIRVVAKTAWNNAIASGRRRPNRADWRAAAVSAGIARR